MEYDYDKVTDVTSLSDVMSNCCGATMYEFGESYMCQDCKEWCDAVTAEEETDGILDGRDREFSPDQLAIIQALSSE